MTLLSIPHTGLDAGKKRPAVLLARLPGRFDDWVVAMISTRLDHEVAGFDEIIKAEDPDFAQTGLKVPSLLRTGRLAVVNGEVMPGMIGTISGERLGRVLAHLRDLFTLANPPT
ncbi:MAG: type II toxin-antitoxin system PemK/MazF family toxin [Deltaproteobacteria bacterium]|nr:type II toxin-antitoxin system PemK/MazF family toxin [Deltaproteobacteria bacterium]